MTIDIPIPETFEATHTTRISRSPVQVVATCGGAAIVWDGDSWTGTFPLESLTPLSPPLPKVRDDNNMADYFRYANFGCTLIKLADEFRDVYLTPDERAAVRALRDHLNTYPGIDDDKPADNLDLWKFRADFIDACAHIYAQPQYIGPRANAARALVAALDASTNGVTT